MKPIYFSVLDASQRFWRPKGSEGKERSRAIKARDTKTHLDARTMLRVTPKEHSANRKTSKEHYARQQDQQQQG